MCLQSVRQEGKQFFVLLKLENKMQLGVWAHCESLSGFSWGPWGKALVKFTIFNFLFLFENNKTKTVSNKKLLLSSKICPGMFAFSSS